MVSLLTTDYKLSSDDFGPVGTAVGTGYAKRPKSTGSAPVHVDRPFTPTYCGDPVPQIGLFMGLSSNWLAS